MEVRLDKRYPVAAGLDACWAVLSDIHAVAACMPGAQITSQTDATHFKGSVKSKVGPAVMAFNGDIEVQRLDAAARAVDILGKGADKAGSSASMQLAAHVEADADGSGSVLVGQATIVVSGKLAQFGSRLLVPVSDALLAQFAVNFGKAAAAAGAVAEVPSAAGLNAMPDTAKNAPAAEVGAPTAAAATPSAAAPTATPPPATPAQARAPAPVQELDALALAWAAFKGWLAGLFGRKG